MTGGITKVPSCPRTGKLIHKTAAAAARHSRGLRTMGGGPRRGGETRPYRCQFCHLWHVAHFPKKPRLE